MQGRLQLVLDCLLSGIVEGSVAFLILGCDVYGRCLRQPRESI